jgi:hypothetical protein
MPGMPRKPKPPSPDRDPEQSKRFIDMAHEVEADEGRKGAEAFERAFKKLIPSRTAPNPSARQSPKRSK